MLSRDAVAAGARHATAAAPETIGLEWLRGECEREERILRLQHPGGRLDPKDEETIARFKPLEDTTRALRLWAYLKHLWLRRSEKLVRAAEPDEALRAAHELLARTPVRVTLSSGRRVEVTGRSVNALTEIAAHAGRIRLLEAALDGVAGAYAEADRRRREAGWWRGRRWRRRMRRLEGLQRRYHTELRYQRMSMWAHCLTRSGAPATRETAPDWLPELTAEDEARLLVALHEAGPGRLARLSAAMPQPRSGGGAKDPRPDFGFDALLVSYGFRLKIPPAECRDTDLGMIAAEAMIGAPPTLDEETEG